ncbi:MAG: type II secretion system protein [Patescibacteria group bacterium]
MQKKGFTLLEMIISMGVFAVAALIGVGSLLALTSAQRKALVFQSTQDNIRFAVEAMARDIRTGNFYYCGTSSSDIPASPSYKDCASGGPSLNFTNVSGQRITYQAIGSRIQKSQDGGPFQAITSSDIGIEYLTFYVIGAPVDDDFHPRVTIVARGIAGSGASRSELSLQTTVSERTVQR